MKYLFRTGKLGKKYEMEMKGILHGSGYRILKIESFADFPDRLFPFCEYSTLPGVPVSPISFSECEAMCSQLGAENLALYKEMYSRAKYAWARKRCIQGDIPLGEHAAMLRRIQETTLPFGAFMIAFRCHRLHDKTVVSHHSGSRIPYAPMLYDIVDIGNDVSGFSCERLAEKLFDENSNDFFQMNIYTDNILSERNVDEIYPVIKELAGKYNEYAAILYHTYKDSEIYRHRDDFPENKWNI